MPKKPTISLPESGKIPIETIVAIRRPSAWAGLGGVVTGYTNENKHHPRVLNRHLVKVTLGGVDFDVAVRFEELRVISGKSGLSTAR